ncbi:hypothetical protein G7Y89_g5766 [Cudoniella acicularis]|uniref:Uncharacterized protein n=1 Tax=Cudoniella acicularis TaxID=354080 RepID=A0A8H4RP30_9HELO|nr:hypothetical protein G7Y89_g5766 [Cudoniella acicularis]
MATVSRISIIYVLIFAQSILALRVTQNSPCAWICLEGSSPDITDASQSSTSGSEIACQDQSFSTTAVGQKFKACVSCLQNSTTTGTNGNDQAMFIYNLRYALSSCLFGFANASDAVSTPCSTSTACGPLRNAIENANLVASNEQTYSYCSVDNDAINDSVEPKCTECLRASGNEIILSNFMVALQAGCQQQPPPGEMIGLDTPPIHATAMKSFQASQNQIALGGMRKSSITKDQITHVGESEQKHWQNAFSNHPGAQLPVYTPPNNAIPTHQAYIPRSSTSSHSTTFSVSPYPSAQTSPAYPPGHSSHKTSTNRTTNYPPINTNSPNPSHDQDIVEGPVASMEAPFALTHTGKHGNRYDFELAEQERLEREARGEKIYTPIKKKNWTPQSAVSEEQWPGSY